MGSFGSALRWLTLVASAGVGSAQEPGPTAVTIAVRPGARQAFDGLGASVGNWGRQYGKLRRDEREGLADLVWRDLRMRTLRLWINLDEFAPDADPAHRTVADFRARYVDSGIVADAAGRGVVHLLLAPDGCPKHLKVKRPGGPADHAIPDSKLVPYADLLADLIARLRDEAGVRITATGLQNEPNDLDRIAPDQMPALVRALRVALDARDLRGVAIIAPESANVDSTFTDAADALRRDPAAWAALGGLASHSYGMAATREATRRVAAGPDDDGPNAKNYWTTEAGDHGPEEPGDGVRAASLAGRFLSDMNHRVTHWVHFLGFEVADPRDGATRIVAYGPRPAQLAIFQKYYYCRQLAATFDPGARFRAGTSDFDGEMTWTYGRKPRVTLAAAANPDGSWGIAAVNFTSPAFRDDPAQPNSSTNGHPARTFRVTVRIPELAGAGPLPGRLRRSGPRLADADGGIVVLRDGTLTLDLNPLELAVLRTDPVPPVAPQPKPAPAPPNTTPATDPTPRRP